MHKERFFVGRPSHNDGLRKVYSFKFMLEYKGFTGEATFDNDANVFHGEVANIADIVMFQSEFVEGLQQALIDSVEDYLQFCKERGEEPCNFFL